ncbi:MAG: hypothetical protein HC828_05770 [Blastochloris sp.]|nr:hypothetical protein [Blastochloris sp.]
MGRWLSDDTIDGSTFAVTAAAAYGAYSRRCETNGERPISQTMWGRRLSERGYTRERRRGAWNWLGFGVLQQPYQAGSAASDPAPSTHQPAEVVATNDGRDVPYIVETAERQRIHHPTGEAMRSLREGPHDLMTAQPGGTGVGIQNELQAHTGGGSERDRRSARMTAINSSSSASCCHAPKDDSKVASAPAALGEATGSTKTTITRYGSWNGAASRSRIEVPSKTAGIEISGIGQRPFTQIGVSTIVPPPNRDHPLRHGNTLNGERRRIAMPNSGHGPNIGHGYVKYVVIDSHGQELPPLIFPAMISAPVAASQEHCAGSRRSKRAEAAGGSARMPYSRRRRSQFSRSSRAF